MKKKIIRWIASAMVFLLLIGLIAHAFPNQTIEPDNPIKQEAAELKTDIRSTGGGSDSEDDDLSGEGEGEDSEEQDDVEKNQEEKLEEEEEETPEDQEEEKPEDQESENDPEDQKPSENKGDGENGDQDSSNPDKDEKGDQPTEGGDETIEGPGTGEEPGEDEHGLVTDLYDRIILFSEVENDTLNFYAYYSDASVDANIRVNYKHKGASGNGTWLKKQGDHDYSTKLQLGQNYITIYYTDENGVRNWTRITISYQADKATEKEPTKGEHPPIIKTNLDDWSEEIKIYEFTFTVDAKKYDGTRIYNNCIQVWLDGELVKNPTGSAIYEYVLEFTRPVVGDTSDHIVSVLAWDDEGNSRYVQYKVRHKVNDEGADIGSVYVSLDVTTLGLGIIDECEVSICSGDSAATAVLKMLEDCGYTYTNSGSLEKEFYLSSISRADAFRGAAIEARLQRLLERDGITFLPNSGRDKLGEFDYTRGSGWLYFINGEYCPGKSMSSYKLNGGEHISLRFTLAFGKDVGSSYSATGTNLSGYCGKWVNGTVIEYAHNYVETERVEPSPQGDGYILYTCTKCKEEKTEPLHYEGSLTPEPTVTPEPTEPEPTPPEVTEPEPTVAPEPTSPEVPEELSAIRIMSVIPEKTEYSIKPATDTKKQTVEKKSEKNENEENMEKNHSLYLYYNLLHFFNRVCSK